MRHHDVVPHMSMAQLEAALPEILGSPADAGVVRLIVARPDQGERRLLDEGVLDATVGLVGDNWLARGSRHTADGSAIPDLQITVMNARVAELVTGGGEQLALPGDQIYVDL